MSAIKRSIVQTAFLCLAQALIIAMARVNGDSKYKSYRDGKALKQPVQEFLSASGADLNRGGCFKELEQFQNYLSDYKIIVYDGLSPESVLFCGNSVPNKKLYLLYDGGHYNVITNIKAVIYIWYICNACDTLYDFTHKCDKACSLCTATPPCTKYRSNYCPTCNRWFVGEKRFQNL